jgi:hypothetical protein
VINIPPRKYTVKELLEMLVALDQPDAPVMLNGCDCAGDNIWVVGNEASIELGYDRGMYGDVIKDLEAIQLQKGGK